jgi:molybdenum cofactor guanylyltransferase
MRLATSIDEAHLMTSFPHIHGILLCGGQSSRMGQPKAWLSLAGQTFFERIAQALLAVTPHVIVVARPDTLLPPPPPGVSRIDDDPTWEASTLTGIASGIASLPASTQAALVVTCDAPLISSDVLRLMIGQWEVDPANSLAIGESEERDSKLIGSPLRFSFPLLISAASFSVVCERVKIGEFSLQRCLEQIALPIDTTFIATVDPQLRSLRNINTPSDYETLVREVNL